MPCNLTYELTSGGRSLHKLGEILSVHIYDLLLDVDVDIVSHPSWFTREQRIIKDFGIEYFDSELPTLYIDEYTTEDPDNWWGITYKDFKSINSRVSNFVSKHESCNIVLKHLSLITPTKLSNWYHNGEIEDDLYTTKLIPRYRGLFDTKDFPLETKERIGIHIRRGDMYWQLVGGGKGLTCKDYQNIIPYLQDYYGLPVTIYTEDARSEDLEPLSQMSGVKLSRGNRNRTRHDFYGLVNSKVLVISPESAYSSWAAYLSAGEVIIPDDLFSKFIHGDAGGFVKFPKNFKNLSDISQHAWSASKKHS